MIGGVKSSTLPVKPRAPNWTYLLELLVRVRVSEGSGSEGEIGGELRPVLLQLLPLGALVDGVPLTGEQLETGLKGDR